MAALQPPPEKKSKGSCPFSSASDRSFHQRALPEWYSGGLQEFSVVYTDRALNHMSKPFQQVMKDLNAVLCDAYSAEQAIILPGSGTFAMEAVARQLAPNEDVLVIRNGYFSFRWSDILDQGGIPASTEVMCARPTGTPGAGGKAQYAPVPLEEVAAAIAAKKPKVVFAPQVETSLGLALPEDYIKGVAELAHAAGALFVLDAIAAGTLWVDMQALGVDFLVTAPQKGWSSASCCGVVMVSAAGKAAVHATTSNSMCLNLKKWAGVMDSYLSPGAGPGHSYYATMPTDALRLFRDTALETQAFGWAKSKAAAIELGAKATAMLAARGLHRVAAPGFEAAGVVVVHSAAEQGMPAKLGKCGLQVATGVPFMLGEEATPTFRMGLFGLDKLADVDGTVGRLQAGIDAALAL